MTQKMFALLMAGTFLVPQISPALSDSVIQKPAKDFAAYLPTAPTTAPWANLDWRTKLPKGDYPLRRRSPQ